MKQNTILIVDDEEDILQMLDMLLAGEGYRIFFANSGLEGLEIIKCEDIHLVISDYRMPGMDGIKFLNTVKMILPDTIRFLLTGYINTEPVTTAIKEGIVYRFITKPWNNIELLSAIKQGIEYYNLQKELIRLNKLVQLQNKKLKEWNFKLELTVSEQTKHMQDLFLDSIKSLVFALESKDKYMEGHSLRITEYATYICKKMSLPEEYTKDVKLGSLLHDIGIIGIKESILDKKGKLTKNEFDHIKTHVIIGEQIMAPFIKNEMVTQIIRHHHEHIDGTGYPDGLKGKEIPLEARIVAVADAYDALLSERPYRKAVDKTNAIKELRRSSGTYFDSDIVEILTTNRGKFIK